MRIYVVVSFDFGGSSDVKVHAATACWDLAQTVYEEVRAAECDSPTDGGHKRLVELASVPADKALVGTEALTLFWGGGHAVNNNT